MSFGAVWFTLERSACKAALVNELYFQSEKSVFNASGDIVVVEEVAANVDGFCKKLCLSTADKDDSHDITSGGNLLLEPFDLAW